MKNKPPPPPRALPPVKPTMSDASELPTTLMHAVQPPPIPTPSFRPGSLICLQCNHIGLPHKHSGAGDILGEVFLWLCCLLPGIIYSLVKKRKDECRACGGTSLVPGTSPAGAKILAGFGMTPADLGGK